MKRKAPHRIAKKTARNPNIEAGCTTLTAHTVTQGQTIAPRAQEKLANSSRLARFAASVSPAARRFAEVMLIPSPMPNRNSQPRPET